MWAADGPAVMNRIPRPGPYAAHVAHVLSSFAGVSPHGAQRPARRPQLSTSSRYWYSNTNAFLRRWHHPAVAGSPFAPCVT